MYWSSTLEDAYRAVLSTRRVDLAVVPSLDDPTEVRALRLGLVRAWRDLEPALVSQVERTPVELIGRELERLARRATDKSPRSVLLALLSEVNEDTLEDVQVVLSSLDDSPSADAFRLAWRELNEPVATRRRSVLIVGGFESERPRVEEFEARHGLEVDWLPAARGQGLAALTRSLGASAARDALIVATGRIAHSLMYAARAHAERRRMPCHYAERLTRRHLDEIAREIARHSTPEDLQEPVITGLAAEARRT